MIEGRCLAGDGGGGGSCGREGRRRCDAVIYLTITESAQEREVEEGREMGGRGLEGVGATVR